MLYENEIIMLVFGFLVTLFIGIKFNQLKHIRSYKILLTGFYLLVAAWFFSNLEEFILEKYLNILEHLFYAGSSIIILIWIYKTFIVKVKVK
jgi:hypothetical protein